MCNGTSSFLHLILAEMVYVSSWSFEEKSLFLCVQFSKIDHLETLPSSFHSSKSSDSFGPVNRVEDDVFGALFSNSSFWVSVIGHDHSA